MKQVVIIDGIKCYSPESALENQSFIKEDFGILYLLEETNFWFRIRSEIISHFFLKYILRSSRKHFLEIGCGTGYVLKCLSSIKGIKLSGSDIYVEGLKYAKKRLPYVDFVQVDITKTYFEDQPDIIGAFDVLEHINDDELAIKNIFKSLKSKGVFILTVPQYQCLWSNNDEAACHKRRYDRAGLTKKIEEAGFKVNYCGSFIFSLFPFMVASRFFQKSKMSSYNEEFNLPGIINKAFYLFSKFDLYLIKCGIKLPFGGSLILIAEK